MVQGLPRQLGVEPRWRDLPALARVQNRRFGLLASVREPWIHSRVEEVGATLWSTLAMSTQLASLVPDRVMGTVAAVDRHAVMRIMPADGGFRRRYAALFVIVGCPVLAGVFVAYGLPFAGISLAIGQAWPMGVGAVLVIGVPFVDLVVSSRRIARATPRTFGTARSSAHAADHFVCSLAAWPPKSGSGSRLMKALSAACSVLAPVNVDFYARPHLVDFYRRFGLVTIDARVGLMRYTA